MALKNSTAVAPSGVALNIDATTNNFSMTINGGTCYGYKLIITDTDNVTQYQTSVITLGTPVYDTEQLSIDLDISSLSTGNTYKWYMQLYEDALVTEYITDVSYIFYSDEVPDLDYTPAPSGTSPGKYYDVAGAVYTVRGTYEQAQDVPIKSWYFSLYNSLQTLIRDYDKSYNQNIVQEFEGLLDGISYWIDFTVETENSYTTTSERIKLIVDYDDVSASIDLTATNNEETSGILNSWGGFVYILGVAVGTAPNYISDFIYTGNYGLDPQSDIEVEDFNTDSTFNYQFVWGNKNTSVDGDIMELENSTASEVLTVTYNNAGQQMELYYNSGLIDSVSFADPTVSTGTWIVVLRAEVNLSQTELFIEDGV